MDCPIVQTRSKRWLKSDMATSTSSHGGKPRLTTSRCFRSYEQIFHSSDSSGLTWNAGNSVSKFIFKIGPTQLELLNLTYPIGKLARASVFRRQSARRNAEPGCASNRSKLEGPILRHDHQQQKKRNIDAKHRVPPCVELPPSSISINAARAANLKREQVRVLQNFPSEYGTRRWPFSIAFFEVGESGLGST